MLTALREGAKTSLLLKIVVFGFIGLGVGGLVFMDVQGYFRDGGMGRGNIVEVDNRAVGIQEFDQRLRRAISSQQIPQELAYRFGMPVRIARAIGNELKVQSYAEALGLQPADADVAEKLRVYIDPNKIEGEASSDTLRRVAASVGVSPARFVNVIEHTITRGLVLDAFQAVASINAPSMKAAFAKSGTQSRDIEAIILKNNQQPLKTPQDDSVLKGYYEQNKAKDFSTPEEKTLRYAILDMDDLAKNTSAPTDEEVQSYYNQNSLRFTKPERVLIQQAVVDSQQQATEILNALTDGDLKQAVIDATGNSAPYREEAEFTQDGLPNALGTAIFEDHVDATQLGPIQTAFGYHIVVINERLPESLAELDEVRDDLVKELQQTEVEDAFFAQLDKVEDRANTKIDIATLAQEFDLSLTTLNNIGLDDADKLSLKEGDESAETIFNNMIQQTPGSAGALIPLSDTRYMIAQADISKQQSFKPYEQVKAQVLKAWQLSQQAKDTDDKAFEISRSDKPLSQHGLPVRSFKGLTQTSTLPSDFGAQALQGIFAANIGDKPNRVKNGDTTILFQVTDINFEAGEASISEEAEAELEDAQSGAIIAGLQAYLDSRYKTKINENLIAQTYRADASQ